MNEYSKILDIKGIGEKSEKLFHKLNIYTVGDLIRNYPRSYDVYEKPMPIGEVREGIIATITGTIYGKVQQSNAKNLNITSIFVKDITGVIKATWFRMPFLRNTLGRGGVVTLRGRIVERRGELCMEQPTVFFPSSQYNEKENTMQPIYPLTEGLTNNIVLKATKQALEELNLTREFLPESIRLDNHLAEYNYAIKQIHFPDSKEALIRARERLVFEEFLVFILGLSRLKETNEKTENKFSFMQKNITDRVIEELPYSLTNAQRKVWNEILEDLHGERVMSRLIQGDVGSGKTIIAVLALIYVAMNGYQASMMAPTEVLAKQHYVFVTELFQKHHIPLSVSLLTGSMTAKEKKALYQKIEAGEVDIIVGTHALIQENVHYKNLALVVTDEQHRFGVKQREKFAEKGNTPHILVMSATPIPRTLAMILYGDLDISVIDELPTNRLPIKNCVVDTSYRKTAYTFIKKQVLEGRQCYVICPMVEDSDLIDAENVLDYTKTLQDELGPTIKVDYLHGRMKQTEKDSIMEKFGANEIQLLVSTTVIEVGINVPNATVMMVENAERFGLAQLHQLRGRVGRGQHQSYCIFMSGNKANETNERLSILNQSNDGFYIANEDLKMRGPGDIFGIRQSGVLAFQLADVFQDADIMRRASEAASQLMKRDPLLKEEENQALKAYLEYYLKNDMFENTL